MNVKPFGLGGCVNVSDPACHFSRWLLSNFCRCLSTSLLTDVNGTGLACGCSRSSTSSMTCGSVWACDSPVVCVIVGKSFSVVCLLCLCLLVRIVVVVTVDKLADQRVWVCMCVQPIVDKLVDQRVSACLRFPYDRAVFLETDDVCLCCSCCLC